MVCENLVAGVLEEFLNCLDIVLLECLSQGHDSNDLFVVFVNLGFTSISVIDLRLAQHAGKNDVDQDVFSPDISTFLVKLKAFEELIESLFPLLLRHEHLATTLLDDTHDSWIVNDSVQAQCLGVNSLHPLLVFYLIAHLDF